MLRLQHLTIVHRLPGTLKAVGLSQALNTKHLSSLTMQATVDQMINLHCLLKIMGLSPANMNLKDRETLKNVTDFSGKRSGDDFVAYYGTSKC
jgi:hypothetical protein